MLRLLFGSREVAFEAEVPIANLTTMPTMRTKTITPRMETELIKLYLQ